MSRRLRTVIPSAPETLKSQYHDPKVIQNKLQTSRGREKMYYDQGAKPLSPLTPGDNVRVKLGQGQLWKSAIVMDSYNDRSYMLQTNDGRVYRRNRRSIHRPPHFVKSEIPETPQYKMFQNTDSQATDLKPHIVDKQVNVPIVNSPVETSAPDSQVNHPYVTRSGRVVKKKVIQSMQYVTMVTTTGH